MNIDKNSQTGGLVFCYSCTLLSMQTLIAIDADTVDDFRLAHCLKYVTIYPDPERGLCLKEGKNMGEVG